MDYDVRQQEILKEIRDSLREMGEGFEKEDHLVINRLSWRITLIEDDRDFWKNSFLNR